MSFSSDAVTPQIIGIKNYYPPKSDSLVPIDIPAQTCDLFTLFQTEVVPNSAGLLPPQEGVVIYQQNIITSGVTGVYAIGNPLQPSQGYFLRLKSMYCLNIGTILYMYQSSFPLSSVQSDMQAKNGNGIAILDNFTSNWGGINVQGQGLIINPGRKIVPVVKSGATVDNLSVMIVAYHLQDCPDNWKLPI